MRYEFTIRGRIKSTVEEALAPLSIAEEGGNTKIVVDAVDDSELYGVLARIERLGLSLIGFEQSPSSSVNGD